MCAPGDLCWSAALGAAIGSYPLGALLALALIGPRLVPREDVWSAPVLIACTCIWGTVLIWGIYLRPWSPVPVGSALGGLEGIAGTALVLGLAAALGTERQALPAVRPPCGAPLTTDLAREHKDAVAKVSQMEAIVRQERAWRCEASIECVAAEHACRALTEQLRVSSLARADAEHRAQEWEAHARLEAARAKDALDEAVRSASTKEWPTTRAAALECLGAPCWAELAEVQPLYRALARLWHPDAAGARPAARDRIKVINVAWEMLKANDARKARA